MSKNNNSKNDYPSIEDLVTVGERDDELEKANNKIKPFLPGFGSYTPSSFFGKGVLDTDSTEQILAKKGFEEEYYNSRPDEQRDNRLNEDSPKKRNFEQYCADSVSPFLNESKKRNRHNPTGDIIDNLSETTPPTTTSFASNAVKVGGKDSPKKLR